MSEHIAPVPAQVPTLFESGYSRKPSIPTDLRNAPVTFFWWAKSPTGRESTHWYFFEFERLSFCGKLKVGNDQRLHQVYVPTNNYKRSTLELFENVRQRRHALLPHLPKGYAWQGPFLLRDIEPPRVESDDFQFCAPALSEGNQMAPSLSRNPKGGLALRLAQRVLATRGLQA